MTDQIVLFDLGNVVVDWDPTRLYRQLLASQEEAERFYREVCTLEWHTHHDRGVDMQENAARLIEAHPDKAELIRAWRTGWLEMFHGYVHGVPEIIQELIEQSTPIYALTNFPAEKWEETAQAFPVLQAFKDVIISGVEKMVKPDPRIYELTLKRLGSPIPSSIIFFDDRQDNIDAAKRAGITSFLFTDAQTMRQDLEKTGILTK
ncbi:HAD family hydrolase [Hirschia baltica]|uniref:HAD-superfamily hydrolase, subfamily IA, variant 3 n=1 Tax=Hirschia baltica (strain ATCC 49814 / DSM 5838 / IFAM 1418) TaxID=582402 RepID=C6XR77_HIRBI|nr:HAD family phosphatase [Hirschia baltica]ACT60608.1 HAD-superfamily hydrolase, subfamily IA, variant 3 [Hirschia baltica ATCC 49814]